MLFLKNFLEPFCYLIYFVLLLLVARRKSNSRFKVLVFYYAFAFISIFYASYLSYMLTKGDNNYLYNIFFPVTICTFSYFYYNLLSNRIKRITVLLILAINLVVYLKYVIVLDGFYETYNNYVSATVYLSMVVYSFLYFHQLISNVSEQNILEVPEFWLTSGYLIYFLGAFFIILIYKEKEASLRAILWSLQNMILFVSAVIALIGILWTKSRNNLPPTPS